MASVGYLQYDIQFGEVAKNLATVDALLPDFSDADLLVLPELAFTGYDFPDKETLHNLAERPESGECIQQLKVWAKKYTMTLVAGYPEKADEGCYNSCALVLPHGTVHTYRKVHLFNREQDLFLPGDAPPKVYNTPAGRVGLMICFDWFFPELARSLAIQGAQILAHPSNLVLQFCQQAMFARCVENKVFAVTANRIGTETQAGRELTFTGASQILDVQGNTLAAAPEAEAHGAVVELEPELADDKTIAERNHLFENRRPELYDGLC